MRNRKIAIIGTAPSWKEAPFFDDTWEIWACNRPGLDLDRWDRLFEIHRIWDHDHQAYLKRLTKIEPPKKVVSIVPLEGVSDDVAVVLDRQDLFDRYGSIWLSCSHAYMLACAIDEQPSEIGVWGVDMEAQEEYVVQFAGVRHFIALAEAKGIKVTMPHNCLLRRNPSPYPDRYETAQALCYEQKADWLVQKIREQERKLREAIWSVAWWEGNRYATNSSPDEVQDAGQHNRLHLLKENLSELRGELRAIRYLQRMFVWNTVYTEDHDFMMESLNDSKEISDEEATDRRGNGEDTGRDGDRDAADEFLDWRRAQDSHSGNDAEPDGSADRPGARLGNLDDRSGWARGS